MGLTQKNYEAAASALFIWLLIDNRDDGFDRRGAWNALALKLLRLWGGVDDARALNEWHDGLPARMQVADEAGVLNGLHDRFQHDFPYGNWLNWQQLFGRASSHSRPTSNSILHLGDASVREAARELLTEPSGDVASVAKQDGLTIDMDFSKVALDDALRWPGLGDNDDWCFSGLALCNFSIAPLRKTERTGLRFERSLFLGDASIRGWPFGKQVGGDATDGLVISDCKAAGRCVIEAKDAQEGDAASLRLHQSVFTKAVNMDFNRVRNMRIGGDCEFQDKCEISGCVQERFDIKRSSFAHLTMHSASLEGIVDIVGNQFDSIDLSGTRCGGEGRYRTFNISGCQFFGAADMAKMHVRGPFPCYAHIRESEFHGRADFSEAAFSARPLLVGVTFHQDVCFDGMKIEQGLSCDKVNFLGKESSWRNMQVGRGMYIDDSEFAEPPLFHGTKLHPDSDFGGIVWREYGGRMPRLLSFGRQREGAGDGSGGYGSGALTDRMMAAIARMGDHGDAWPYKKRAREWEWLEKQMENMGRHDERHQFFRYAMFAKRMTQTKMGAVFALGNWLYWRTSNYGWSVVSPLVGWTITLAGAWMAFACASDVGVAEAGRAALRDVMLLAPRSWECDASAAGNGLDCGMWWRPVFKVLSTTFLFLLGLGIRNRFRLRA